MTDTTKVIQTVCGQCMNGCSIKVTVKDGKIQKIEGVANDPRTKGGICAKSISGKQLTTDPKRLKYPVRRAGARGENKWERISWDEAYTEIAQRFNKIKEEHGPRAVGFYNGQASGWDFNYQMYQRLAHSFGTDTAWGTSECFVPRLIGQAMTYGGMPLYPDYENANMIVLWGRQPTNSSPTCTHFIFDAQERGAKLVSIDPLRNFMSAKADEYIRIEPGTDLALALAMIYVIIEDDLWDKEIVNQYSNDPGLEKLREHVNGGNSDGIAYTPEWASGITGIPAKTIRDLARDLAKTRGVCIVTGHGLEGRINVTQTARAIAILRVITANIDAPGGDVMTDMSPKLNAKFTLNNLVNPEEKSPEFIRLMNVPAYNPPESTWPLNFAMQGCIPTPDAMRMIDEGKTKAGIIQSSNPAVMLGNAPAAMETINKLEFIVVVDPYISKTARDVADIVLPAAIYLERTEPTFFQYERWMPYMRLRRQCTSYYEALPDWLICIRLAHALGLGEYFPTEDVEYWTNLLLEPSGITYEDIASNQWVFHSDIEYQKYKKEGFGCPGGVANIYSVVFEQMGYEPLPRYYEGSENTRSTPEIAKEYPYTAFTGRPNAIYVQDQGRTLPWLREIASEPYAMVNTLDAREQDIKSGDWLQLESLRGKITIKAEVTNKVGKGMIYCPGGWENANFNVLGIDEDTCPISSQANYMTCLVNMKKIDKVLEEAN